MDFIKAHTAPWRETSGEKSYVNTPTPPYYYYFFLIIICYCVIHILRVVASTQFEPTSARAAFPCFDEPAFKANFTVRIRREAQHIALSNMPKVL